MSAPRAKWSPFLEVMFFEVSKPKIWFLDQNIILKFQCLKSDIWKISIVLKKLKKSGGISLIFFEIWNFVDKNLNKKYGGIPDFFFEIWNFLTKIWFLLDKILKKIWGYPKIFFDIWDFLTKIWKKSGGTKNIFRNLKFFDKNLKKIGGGKSGC